MMEIKIKIPDIESLELIETYVPYIVKSKKNNTIRKRYVNKLIPHKAGIYLLYNEKKELMYIGQTEDLTRRIGSHHSGSGWGWCDDWSNLFYISKPKYVKFFVVDGSTRYRIAVEQLLIDKLNPIFARKSDIEKPTSNVTKWKKDAFE